MGANKDMKKVTAILYWYDDNTKEYITNIDHRTLCEHLRDWWSSYTWTYPIWWQLILTFYSKKESR